MYYRQYSYVSKHNYFLPLKNLLASELSIAHVIPEREIIEVKEGGKKDYSEDHVEKKP